MEPLEEANLQKYEQLEYFSHEMATGLIRALIREVRTLRELNRQQGNTIAQYINDRTP